MKRIFSVLILLLGLGSSFSFGESLRPWGPFGDYLASLRSGKHQATQERFAYDCGVNLQTSKAHFAQMPGETWKEVKTLSHALQDQETDFYSTAAVWSRGKTTLVEMWDLDLELGTQRRRFFCLEDTQIESAEELDWQLFSGEDLAGKVKPHWLGYEQLWKRESTATYSGVHLRYVNRLGHQVPKPTYENQVPEAIEIWPAEFTWKDLKLPDSFLR